MPTTHPRTIHDADAFAAGLEDVLTFTEQDEADRVADLAEADFQERLRATDRNLQSNRAKPMEETLYDRMALVAETCSSGPVEYDVSDVVAWFERATAMSTRAPRLGIDTVQKIHRVELVPNAPFRDAYLSRIGSEDGDRLLGRIAVSMDAPRETTWVRKLLGLEENDGTVRMFIDREHAEALAVAMRLDPYLCGV